ncbi:MAG: hypothetical protein AB8B36_05790 [Prochlorococcus sp.]
MQRQNFMLSFLIFAALWSIWLYWSVLEPEINTLQVSLLLLILPTSLLLVAFSFLDNEDDDHFNGGLLQPIPLKAQTRSK